jgi:tetratricopeptide (TPR) repeat protein
MAVWQGQQAVGLAHLQESLSIWQRLEDEQWVGPILLANGIALINMGRDSEAQPLMEEARGMLEEQHRDFHHTATLTHLGNAELGLGQPEKARIWLEQALAKARAIGESWLLSFTLNNLGEVARTQGHYEQARKYYEESEALLRTSGDKGDLARLVHSLGYVAQHEGNFPKAEAQFNESLTMFRQLGNRRGIAECLAGLAGLKARQGQAEQGAVLLSAAEAYLTGSGGAWWPSDRAEIQRNREAIRAVLSETAYTQACEKGRSLTIDQALRVVEGA